MTYNQEKLFPSQEEVVEKKAVTPKEKAAKEKEIEKTPKFVEKTAKCNVNVRKEPRKEDNIAYVLTEGSKIKVIETEEIWLKTEDGNYIMGEYLY